MIDRDAVRSNAKYLRNVRPIDPEEISEYIEGQPHPAVVRRALREEAYDLGLYERADGSFVPVSDDPVSPGWSPRGLPGRYEDAVEDLLVEHWGLEWHRGESGDHLREVIRRLKEDYYYQNPVEYDYEAALGYAVYHLPDYYAAIGYVLDDIAERSLLPRRLRVLDVGAGVGGPALGLHDYLPEESLVEYHAVEPGESADVLETVLEETRQNFRPTIHRTHAETFEPTGEYDVVLFANVLSELDDPVSVVERYLDFVADDGALVALAPADLNTSTGLRSVERTVAPPDSDVTVYAPTLRLWPDSAPTDRGWSFDERPDVEAPSIQTRLDVEAAGEDEDEDGGTFVNTSVKFSYFALRTDGVRRWEGHADPRRHAKMAEMERHVTDRIDLLAVKLSRNLAEADGNPLFKIGDGSEQTEHYAVLTQESMLNNDVLRADYGDVVAFENVLVLWNDDEGAYNLVVDGETVVDSVG